MITDKEDQMFSCIYGCPMDNIKTLEELLEHYDLHSEYEMSPVSLYDHVYLQHLPFGLNYESRHKE